MSEARELIARAACNGNPDECIYGSGSANFGGTSHYECHLRAWEQNLPLADAIIAALTAAGYRIIGPGEPCHIERAFREGIQYATNCKVTDIDLAWETSAARARALSDTP